MNSKRKTLERGVAMMRARITFLNRELTEYARAEAEAAGDVDRLVSITATVRTLKSHLKVAQQRLTLYEQLMDELKA